MSRLELGLMLAVLGSLALNGSYLLQHAGANAAPPVDVRRPVATVRGLLSSRVWLIGAAVGSVGIVLHIAALARAPLAYVQAFLAGGIALLAPAAVILLRHRLSRSEIAGAVLMAVALVLIAAGLGDASPHGAFADEHLAAYLGGGVVVALALVALGRGPRRAHALGLAGGFLYGVGDAGVKAVTHILGEDGIPGVLTSAWPYITFGLMTLGFFAFTRGLQTGRALPVIALMSAGTNVVSIAAGFVVFGDPIGSGTAFVVLHVIGFLLVGVAAWLLAPAQAAIAGGESTATAPAPAAAAASPATPS